MGGKLTLTQITSDGLKKSCKVGTWFLEKMGSLDFLNETYFNEFVVKNNLFSESKDEIARYDSYDEDSAMFAPYDYGIVVFDFKDKKVFSCNNYNGFLIFGTKNIESEYEKIGRLQQESSKTYDVKGNMISEKSIYEENDLRLITPRMIESCLRNKGNLYIDKTPFIYEENDNYFTVATKIYGKDLSLLTKEQEQNYIQERYNTNKSNDSKYDLKNWLNIEIKKEGWEILNGDGTNEYIKNALTYYDNSNQLTEKENRLWKRYLKE